MADSWGAGGAGPLYRINISINIIRQVDWYGRVRLASNPIQGSGGLRAPRPSWAGRGARLRRSPGPGAGLASGRHLQAAACILPLAHLPIETVVARFRGLAADLRLCGETLSTAYYEPLALLSLLDHEPWEVVERLRAVAEELDAVQPDGAGSGHIIIAADVTFLELVRTCRGQVLPPLVRAHSELEQDMQAFHLASAVLVSQVHTDIVHLLASSVTQVWPYI